jgi:enoyl-CoA hydratase
MNFADYAGVEFEQTENGILLITLAEPWRKNSLRAEVHRQMGGLWKDVSNDRDIRVAVVTGKGDAFCAGGDLGIAEETNRVGAGAVEAELTHARDLLLEMISCHKPIISAINGVAVGAGLAMALGADISIINEDTYVFDGHMQLGIAAGDHSVLLWPLLTSMASAKYYLLTGERISGREAAGLGLVSRAVPADAVLETALDIAHRLADGPQAAIRFTKRALNMWMLVGMPAFELSLAYELIGELSEDFTAGVEAVRTKTPPTFPSARVRKGPAAL